jgi:FAD/FMN-containing dehydrogenase
MTTQPTPSRPPAPPAPKGAIDKDSLARLRSSLRGRLFAPSDEGYETARKVYNGMIDRHPAAVVSAADAADVASAVNFARAQGRMIAVRGGGHNPNGFATCDDGVVVDLSLMRGVRVDPTRRVARVDGGCRWADVDHATFAFGLAVPGGVVSSTGVGGLTLGGGIGHLARMYGLSIDSLISADVVLADGQFVTTSAKENPDLFWAIRGGGGNFGVVTSFEFALHPAGTVFGGPVIYPLKTMRDALKMYRAFMKSAPPEVNAFFALLIVPPADPFPKAMWNERACGVVTCYIGPHDQGAKALAPLRTFGPPAVDLVGPIPLPALQSMFDPLVPPGMLHYWKADFVREITDAAIDEHVKHAPGIPTVSSVMHIYPTDGAVHRVPADATAFHYRDANFVHVIASMYTNPSDTPKNVQWARDYWSALHPHSEEGTYVNFMMDEPATRLKATYGANFDRLSALKKKYDPTNAFRLNQNIAPK